MDTSSLDNLCNLLGRSRLVTAGEVPGLRQRWERVAGRAGDAAGFCKWLVAGQHITDYQAGQLLRGHADRFFLNDYKLLERIGAGRMAGVYKAVHALGLTVAIKVLPPSKAKDANTLARFQREGRLSLRLKHPHVVRTYQVAEDHGLYFIVMEYLEGETLAEVLKRRGKLSPVEGVHCLHQGLLGLQYLHEEGMVHRDLNPSNLMLVSPAGGGAVTDILVTTVKILDIGLGRALFDESGDPGGADVNLTTDGVMLGTPDYLAPEQARDAHAADIRSDIYSMGCTLFHALAGQPPFPDANMVRKMMRHAGEPVPALKKFNPTVPDGLQQIVNWMMAKDPAQRYPTPERAAQALHVFLAAGADKEPREEAPKMRAYLEWLDSVSGEEILVPEPPTVVIPKSAPAAPIAVAAPLAPSALASTREVELAPVAPKKKLTLRFGRLSRRDALMLWIGAGFLAVAGSMGVVIRHILRKNKIQMEPEEPKRD